MKVFGNVNSMKVFDNQNSMKVFDNENSMKIFDNENSMKVFYTRQSSPIDMHLEVTSACGMPSLTSLQSPTLFFTPIEFLREFLTVRGGCVCVE